MPTVNLYWEEEIDELIRLDMKRLGIKSKTDYGVRAVKEFVKSHEREIERSRKSCE